MYDETSGAKWGGRLAPQCVRRYGPEGRGLVHLSCKRVLCKLSAIDLSVILALINHRSQNTYSTAVMIGEKAATIIAEELGIKGV